MPAGPLFIIQRAKTGDFAVVKQFDNHTDRSWDVKYSPSNKYLASSSDDKTVIIRDARSYRACASPP